MNRKLIGAATLAALALIVDDASAQQPYPQQPYPPQPQPYPQQPVQPQPYPQQPYPQQPYPPQPQPYPQQPYPQQPVQPYPQQPQQPYQPYPQQPVNPYQPYPQQPVYPPQPYQPYPPQPVQPVAPPQSTVRAPGEMAALYITSGLYGVGTGIWLDSLFKLDDPGLAVIMPIAFGAGAPVGMYFWDRSIGGFKRGVPASMATGLVLGGLEGMAIAGTQWQYTREKNKDWHFNVQTSVTWILATAGGVGGFFFGNWLEPDPRSMTFIVSGAGWGTLSGGMLGIAFQGRHDDWKDGSSIAGLIGYNALMAGAGAISIFHTPSFQSQKYMWLGYLAGAVAGCIVFPFYLANSDANAKHGFIGPSLGGLAGVGVAGALTWNSKDAGQAKNWKPPIDLAMAPVPPLTPTTSETTASSRSVMHLVGPDPRFSSAPQGGMISAVKTF